MAAVVGTGNGIALARRFADGSYAVAPLARDGAGMEEEAQRLPKSRKYVGNVTDRHRAGRSRHRTTMRMHPLVDPIALTVDETLTILTGNRRPETAILCVQLLVETAAPTTCNRGCSKFSARTLLASPTHILSMRNRFKICRLFEIPQAVVHPAARPSRPASAAWA